MLETDYSAILFHILSFCVAWHAGTALELLYNMPE